MANRRAREREFTRRKQLKALEKGAGAWKDEYHPELPVTMEGLANYLRQLRNWQPDEA